MKNLAITDADSNGQGDDGFRIAVFVELDGVALGDEWGEGDFALDGVDVGVGVCVPAVEVGCVEDAGDGAELCHRLPFPNPGWCSTRSHHAHKVVRILVLDHVLRRVRENLEEETVIIASATHFSADPIPVRMGLFNPATGKFDIVWCEGNADKFDDEVDSA